MDCAKVITLVKRAEIEFVAGSGPPESKVVGVVSVVSRHWCVVGLRDDNLATFPVSASGSAVLIGPGHSSKPNVVDHVTAFNFPRITLLEPEVRNLNLLAVLDLLLEDTEVIPDAVAPCWNLQCCQRV